MPKSWTQLQICGWWDIIFCNKDSLFDGDLIKWGSHHSWYLPKNSATKVFEAKKLRKKKCILQHLQICDKQQKCVNGLNWDKRRESPPCFFTFYWLFKHTYSILNYAESAYITQAVHKFLRCCLKNYYTRKRFPRRQSWQISCMVLTAHSVS